MTHLPAPPDAGFFAEHTVTTLAGELRAGRTSPDELVEQALREASRLDPVLNAFVTLDESGARAAARRATRELAGGVDRGPLHGIPVAVKDMVDTAGLRTTMGSRHFADRVPDRDAACVSRLREAGAVILGKTTTHEFAYGPTGDRAATGPTHNPYRHDHMTGGSSCGSAAAVAAGIVPLAIGTDTGGSVRIPAACCGIVGLRPTYAAVPTDGVFPLSPWLDTVGPLARTAADCRLLWQVLAGRDPAGTPASFSTGAPPRIAWVADAMAHPIAAEVAGAARRALEPLGDSGTREVSVPDIAGLRWAYQAIQGSEAYAVHTDRVSAAPDLYDEEVLERLRAAAQVRGWEYVRAREIAEAARAAVAPLLGERDVLALPTVPMPAPRIGARHQRIGDVASAVRGALLSLTSPWSVLGLPAISVPAGLVDGLPVGLQLVARAGGEELLLAAARRLYEATQDEATQDEAVQRTGGGVPRPSPAPDEPSRSLPGH